MSTAISLNRNGSARNLEGATHLIGLPSEVGSFMPRSLCATTSGSRAGRTVTAWTTASEHGRHHGAERRRNRGAA